MQKVKNESPSFKQDLAGETEYAIGQTVGLAFSPQIPKEFASEQMILDQFKETLGQVARATERGTCS